MNQSKGVQEALQKLPSVDEVLQNYNGTLIGAPHKLIVKTVRSIIQKHRKSILSGENINNLPQSTYDAAEKELTQLCTFNLNPVINGTGIVLHTGLGRSPISKEILQGAIESVYPYTNIELQIRSGKRGERNHHVEKLLNSLTSSESSLIVNNNAAAVLLMLNAVSEGKDVIISRGQQVEIGGSFRIPDVIEKSGCNMVEVGTTNKTHLKDYESAIHKNTGAILVAHTSNYKVIGFTKNVELAELATLAKRKRVPLLVDLGSGAIADFSNFDMQSEPTVSTYLKAGVHAVSFSGDKLLGGPQAGIICGKKNLIKKMHQNALYRALRCDKLTFAILEKILRTYSSAKDITSDNLAVQLLSRDGSDLEKMGESILAGVRKSYIGKHRIELVESKVEAGSGSLPTEEIPSMAITFSSSTLKPSELSALFRRASIPILGYIHGNKFRIDLKAIPAELTKVCTNIFNEVLC
jgi:L-seryl-tRNA(Ser) seleniumtransferase